MNNEQRTDW